MKKKVLDFFCWPQRPTVSGLETAFCLRTGHDMPTTRACYPSSSAAETAKALLHVLIVYERERVCG